MLAVVGSEKTATTTTALGVACRAPVPATVVDADWHAPALAARAGVERGWPTDPCDRPRPDDPPDAPITARLARSWTDAPGDTARPRIVPAPRRRDRRDPRLEHLLRAAGGTDRWTVIDCPSGTGRNARRAVSLADRALVTTTLATRAVRAARATVRVARAHGTPVVGAIVSDLGLTTNRSSDTDESTDASRVAALDVSLDPSVFRVVPHVASAASGGEETTRDGPTAETLLTDERVRSAHRSVAAAVTRPVAERRP